MPKQIDKIPQQEYIPYMEYKILMHKKFIEWLEKQKPDLQEEILANTALLKEFGPNLGRPKVDTLKGTRHSNLKELRIQYKGEPWRILFAFDPERSAILLIGGNKKVSKRWYKDNIYEAEKRLDEHLSSIVKNPKRELEKIGDY